MEPKFAVGQQVALKVDQDRQGVVMRVLPAVAGKFRYQVFLSPSDQPLFSEEQLTAVATLPPDRVEQSLARREWVDADSFLARMTAARLAHPLVDSLYSLQAARIQFIPFQFKPLLRFLRADQPRLLIADEVGVGKTIEAGLILRELQTRQAVNTVLIVCPKALVTKWQAEMRRFDERFLPLDARTLQYCLREAYLDGVWPTQYAKAIVHLELLRGETYLTGKEGINRIPGIADLSTDKLFELMILDEAHHVRNVDTNSHQVIRFLSEKSEAVVFLSATPVHTGAQNLWALLNLLREDLFPSLAVFDEVVEPASHLNAAIRCIRTRPLDIKLQHDAVDALERAAATSWGQLVLGNNPQYKLWHERLCDERQITDEERVLCIRAIEEIHPLSHVMNRTRRRDIGRFTVREPHTVEVPFTHQQSMFYQALVEFRYRFLLMEHDPRIARLILDMLERQASSCLPAIVPVLNRFIRTGRLSGHDVTDVDESEGELVLPPDIQDLAKRLLHLGSRLPPDDPKLDRLLSILVATMEDEGPRKLLVFSYFLNTLHYLELAMSRRGYRVAAVTGRVPEEEREHLHARFRLRCEHPDAIDVLLSSEVGCEGLDYEFCDRLVNYDIPWNPMRIEQRIGRLDRFGQRSEKILIYNFITPGTVEQRIYYRCFERLGIFREALGDLEEVLGDLVRELNQAALDPQLTPEQAEEKAWQRADNLLRLIAERRHYEEESAALLSAEQFVADEVNDIVDSGRFVTPTQLEQMIAVFLVRQHGGHVQADSSHPKTVRLRVNREGRDSLRRELQRRGMNIDAAFRQWLDGDEAHLSVTFDQETAVELRECPFITPVHPLSKLAIDYFENMDTELVGNLGLTDPAITSGKYVFVFDLWEKVSVRPEIQLTAFAWDVEAHTHAQALSQCLVNRLADLRPREHTPILDDDALKHALKALDGVAEQAREAALVGLQRTNDYLISRKLASLDAGYRNRLQRVKRELSSAEEARIQRMKRSEMDRIEREFEDKRARIERCQRAEILMRRVAAGILTVERHEDGQQL